MNMERPYILLVAPVVCALANWLPNNLSAEDLQEAKVTQVVQDVKVVPSGAAARPVAVNETVRQGNAVQTGSQSRSELTFKDETITRLGEKTIYNIGGGRTIELGSGQFLLYVPKNKGGAKVKMGPVTAAITGTTVLGNVLPSGLVQFTVLEGSAWLHRRQKTGCHWRKRRRIADELGGWTDRTLCCSRRTARYRQLGKLVVHGRFHALPAELVSIAAIRRPGRVSGAVTDQLHQQCENTDDVHPRGS